MHHKMTINRLLRCGAFLLLCNLLLAVTGCGNNSHHIVIKESLIELSCSEMKLTSTEKQQINTILLGCYCEDNTLCGFYSSNDSGYINPRTTAYALALATWTGFSYDHEKINAFLKEQYEALPDIQNSYEKAEMLYYLVGIDQIANNYLHFQLDDKTIQLAVDDIFEQLSGKEQNTASELEAVRKTVEIVSDLQLFNRNVFIKEKYVATVKSIISNALKDEMLSHSVFSVDMKLIDEYLGLSIVKESVVADAFFELKTDRGVKYVNDAEVEPDIFSTFLFLKLAETDLWSESPNSFASFADVFSLDSVLQENESDFHADPTELYLICYLEKVDHSNATK